MTYIRRQDNPLVGFMLKTNNWALYNWSSLKLLLTVSAVSSVSRAASGPSRRVGVSAASRGAVDRDGAGAGWVMMRSTLFFLHIQLISFVTSNQLESSHTAPLTWSGLFTGYHDIYELCVTYTHTPQKATKKFIHAVLFLLRNLQNILKIQCNHNMIKL